MSHDRKKAGHRKDKENAKMRESVAERHADSTKEPHRTDQTDIQTFKPGSAGDRNRHPSPPASLL